MRPQITLGTVLLTTVLIAQDEPSRRRVDLPAGDWPVAQLIAAAAEALGCSATAIPDLREHGGPIHLPLPLTLDAATGSEALAALLHTRQLLLARDAHGGLVVHAGRPATFDWLAIAPVYVSWDSLFDHPFAAPLVTVELPRFATPRALAAVLAGKHPASGPLRVAEVDGIPFATGIPTAVIDVLCLLDAMDPDFATPPQPQPRIVVSRSRPTAVQLPAGDHLVATVLDAFAAVAGVNVVMEPRLEAAAPVVHLDEPLHLRSWEVGPLSQLLWRHRVMILNLDVGHALYEAVLVDSPEHAPPRHRASRRSVDALLELDGYITFATTHFEPNRIDMAEVWSCLHIQQRAATAQDLGIHAAQTASGVQLTGTTPELTRLLRTLTAAEQRLGG